MTKADIKKAIPAPPKVRGPRHTKCQRGKQRELATHASDYTDGLEEEERPLGQTVVSAAVSAKQDPGHGKVAPTPEGACVVYLGHIPHGFYEEQMRGFFSQFGTVTRLRLARNKKTGRSKHFAFIEFKRAEVGEVVAKAMNGYLMFSKVLVAKVMATKSLHPQMFKGANRPFKVVDRVAGARKVHNAARAPAKAAGRERQLVRGERKKRAQLTALGIEYEFGGYTAAAAAPGRRVRGVLSCQSEGSTTAGQPGVQLEEPPSAKKVRQAT